jgi:hypothetical protein
MRMRFSTWCRSAVSVSILLTGVVAWAQTPTVEWKNDPQMQGWANTYDVLYDVDWKSGFGAGTGVQANPGDLIVVDDPAVAGRKAVQASIRLSEDFSKVANGAPRAELLLPEPVRFAQGHDYLIRWSTYLPSDFAFDSKQLLIITQIHQDLVSGSPTIALTLLGTQYAISERGGVNTKQVSGGEWLCCADVDRGKWIYWTLRYIPDETGQHALTELYKNGISVFATTGAANAYPNVQNAYLKIGLYKPGWKSQPSDVTQSTVLYGPVNISQR